MLHNLFNTATINMHLKCLFLKGLESTNDISNLGEATEHSRLPLNTKSKIRLAQDNYAMHYVVHMCDSIRLCVVSSGVES